MNHDFRVRWYQRAFHEALVTRSRDRLIAIWHRRAGKDEVVLNGMRDLALKNPGTYWHCFPEQKQARKAIWLGVNSHTGQRRIFDAFPQKIVRRLLDDEMFLELKNGATFQLIGSDRYDSTVGSGPKGIAYSEWALSDPAAWAYHSPMIRESGGFAAFITTPRGNNHAKTMYDTALRQPETWFAERLSVEDTGALTPAQLAEARQEYVDLWGESVGQAYFEQEYLCSFDAAILGAYFGLEMSAADREGRIRPTAIDWSEPVHTAWDLGKAANNPIWCFQVIGDQPRIVDFYRPSSDDVEEWAAWLDAQGYRGIDYVPHDIMVTEWGSKRTRIETLRLLGRKPRRVARVSVEDGRAAARQTIKAALFHTGTDERGERMQLGLDGLKQYRREWDEELRVYRETPVKDWAEHIGSAFRYLGLAWKDATPPEKPVPKPTELEYRVGPGGVVTGNLSVKDAVKAMVRRRRRENG